MYLEDKPNYQSMTDEIPCVDYVQFGRDTLHVTTYTSPYYCGKRDLLPLKNSNGTSPFTGGQGNRMHVEVQDREMDVWINLTPRPPTSPPRVLTMTVTTIKLECGSKDPFYRQCLYTSHCIRREFFCDGRINCAWPSGDAGGTDEFNCDKESK